MDSVELKSGLNDLKERLNKIREGTFDVSSKEKRLQEIEADLAKEEVWSDLELSQKISKEKTALEKSLILFKSVEEKVADGLMFLEIAEAETKAAPKPDCTAFLIASIEFNSKEIARIITIFAGQLDEQEERISLLKTAIELGNTFLNVPDVRLLQAKEKGKLEPYKSLMSLPDVRISTNKIKENEFSCFQCCY